MNDPFQSDDPVLARMNSHPPFRRAYWRAIQDAVQGPLVSSTVNRFLDERYQALLANGVPVSAPDDIKNFIQHQRAYLAGRLATLAGTFTVKTPFLFDTNQSLLKLSGTAPVEVAALTVNGIAWPVTWTSLNAWTSQVAFVCGTNQLTVSGIDNRGRPIPQATVVLPIACGTPPAIARINEWMASNTRTLRNPETGKFDDWFEIYNPSSQLLDLGGYYLTDTLTNKSQFRVPSGFPIPAEGFLLVWADGKPELNLPVHAGLHAGFQLDKGGEAIYLFAPDGTQVDYKTDLSAPEWETLPVEPVAEGDTVLLRDFPAGVMRFYRLRLLDP